MQVDAIHAAIAAAIPVGLVAPFAGDSAAVPAGWLPCDGSEVDRTTYADLFAVVSTRHGGGDGITTFHLPDYRGRFLRGVDGGAGRDLEAGAREAPQPGDIANGAGVMGDQAGSIQTSATALPVTPFTTDDPGVHNHTYAVSTVDDSNNCCVTTIASQGDTAAVAGNPATSAGGAHVHDIVGGGDAETRPENAAVSYIIKH